MKRVIYSGCFCVVALMSSLVGSSFGKDILPISCSPERSVVRSGEAIMLRVWARGLPVVVEATKRLKDAREEIKWVE